MADGVISRREAGQLTATTAQSGSAGRPVAPSDGRLVVVADIIRNTDNGAYECSRP